MKTFFGSCLGTLTALLLFLIFVVALVTASGVGFISSVQNLKQKKGSAGNGLLVIDLSIPIADAPDQIDQADLSTLLRGSEKQTLLRELLASVKRAATDSKISGVLVTGNAAPSGYASGLGTLKEVRDALIEFKKSRKPVLANLSVPTTRTFYLASVADTIYLDPFYGLGISGLASEPLFYADALRRYGIGVQVTKVGKYKSAVEPFVNDRMSPEYREQLQKLLGDLWQEITSGIEDARQLTPGTLQRLISEKGIVDAGTALREKLVTALKSQTDVINELRGRFGEDEKHRTFRQVSVNDYADASDDRPKTGAENSVGVVYAEGDILDGEGSSSEIGGDRYARAIRKFRLDKNIKAIVLRVNSPGGSALASEVIRRELVEAKKVKPVVVSMGTVAASGGYWISTASNRIFAEPGTITGSIGVFGLVINLQKLANDHGVNWDEVETTPYSKLLSVARPKTEAELAIIQQAVNRIYDDFKTRVSQARDLPVEKVEEIAQGRVWSGAEAVKLHLVDEFGGLQSALDYAAKLAKLGAHPRLAEYPEHKDILTILNNLTAGSSRPPVARNVWFRRAFGQVEADMDAILRWNDPESLYARMPVGLDWNW